MIHPAIPVGLLALAVPAGASIAQGVEYAQLTVHERIVIRVPRMSVAPIRAPKPVEWKEKKGPKCLAVTDFAGALIAKPGTVDLVMQGGRRYRAKLEGDCRQLDFYSGFYIKPSADGRICADRDAIRVRSGAACEIETFRSLEPKR